MNLQKSILPGLVALMIPVLCLVSVFKANGFVANTYEVAEGSRFTILSAQVGMDAFHGDPEVYIEMVSDGNTFKRTVKVVESGGYPRTDIICQWASSKIPPGTYSLWVLPSKKDKAEKPMRVTEFFMVKGPVITGIQRDPSDVRKVTVTGRYFGSRVPLLKLSYSYPGNENIMEEIACPILRPLAFGNGEGRDGGSCMDPFSGESSLDFLLPQNIPDGLMKTVHLQNRAGSDFAVLEEIERDDVVVGITAFPAEGGTTNPQGNITVSLNNQFEITAIPGQGFRFVRWDKEGNMDILNNDLPCAVVLPRGNGSVTAVFEPVEMAFDGIMTAGAAIINDPDTGSMVSSSANLTWKSAYCADTPASGIKYHIYLGETDDVDVLYREVNRVETLTGVTEAAVPLDPVPGAVHYLLVVAEDGNGNRNENHRPVPVLNQEITFKKRMKDVGEIVSAGSSLALTEDETILTIKKGDYWSSFEKEDVILFNVGGKQHMNRVYLVYLEGEDTILWLEPATFSNVIQGGEWNSKNHVSDSQEAWEGSGRSFEGRIDFGQGASVYGRIINKEFTLHVKTKFPRGSRKSVSARLTGIIGFEGRLKLNLQAGANNNPGERKPLFSGKFISYGIMDGKKIKSKTNLVADLFLDFKTEKAVNMVQSIKIKKRFDVSVTIYSDETYDMRDHSDDLVFEADCNADNFSDMDIYFNLKPRIVSSLLDKNPDTFYLSMGIEQKIKELNTGFMGYGLFDITATGSRGITWSTRNFWLPAEYHSRDFHGQTVTLFTLPQVDLAGSVVSMEMDTTERFVMYWKDGENNQVHLSEVVWDYYNNDGASAYGASAGPVVKTEDGYKRTLYFTPRAPGRWTITMSAKGDGFLRGDLGVVYDSVDVYVYE